MSVLSPTISKLYTPPTCTLEVTAKASPLSRWTGTPTVRSLQFLLSFDSLAQRARESVEIYGDQTQLSTLTETVTQYIQTVLANRVGDLPLSVPEQPDSPAAAPDISGAIALRPRSLLTHELWLGNLATEQSGPSLLLKASQLYDLATALEDCTADLQQLPTLIGADRPAVMPFLRSAALVVLVVGLGTATLRLFQTGPVAVNPSDSNSKTAMAPAATPVPSPLPPVPSAPSRSLKLPSIQLPTRSSNPSAPNPFAQKDLNLSERSSTADVPAKPSPETARRQSSPSMTSVPPENLAGSTQDAAGQQSVASAPSANASISRSRALSQSLEAAPAPSKAAEQATLFDTTPQVAEVRSYVATRWQPSTPPPKTLEYRVTINGDGSLGTVDPLGVSAQQYLSQVPLPQSSAAFVSPPASGSRQNIRMLLHPDGTVQTFLDAAGQ
jgi:Domain of unknown function (DUF4335)